MSNMSIREADRVEITILTDNYTDMLTIQGSDVIRRPQIRPPNALYAEHGLSCLVRVTAGTDEHVLLMDAGITPGCLIHNAGLLHIDPGWIEAVMLSHGHFDHFGGLAGFPAWLPPGTPLILHPDAFLPRRLNNPAIGPPVEIPALDEAILCKTGADVHQSRSPVPLASGLLLTTGEVDRITPFEKGFPLAEAKIDGYWVVDPFHDDQGLVASVKGKGLVVISGCAHAGIINTVGHAKKMTGTGKVHAVLGGFHLTGPTFDPIIQPTIDEMKRINPDYLIPMHCTGWKAINGFAAAMPGQFILNTVGTTYVFTGT
jgi:7,8-dihydropterin-6-yl-methyl-4-(beta-D-ribofuranosyl)aminobenzene 5'-phosphate synthase